MGNEKKVFSAVDTAPATMYAKQSAGSEFAYPVLVNADGALFVIDDSGMVIPRHDTQVIDESGSDATITYKLLGATVATKTIVVTGTRTTISISYS